MTEGATNWVDCACGERHWGRYGAAGLLVIRDGAVLLQDADEHTGSSSRSGRSAPGSAPRQAAFA